MLGRIIRGAFLGTVLGVVIGVALSGAMYMFNYMREGVSGIKDEGLVVETSTREEDGYTPALSVNGSMEDVYNFDKLQETLDLEGITGMAREVALERFNGEHTPSVDKYQTYEETTGDVAEATEEYEQDTLGDSLLRFHVRANSNSDVDIALKYQVRDAVIAGLEKGLKNCTTLDEAKAYVMDSLGMVEDIALDTLSASGYNYAVNVYLTNDYFPMRQYGDMVLPAGYYEALRVDIGLANGENFWCLLYPTMCVPVEAGGVITREGQQELEKALTVEEYDKLFVKKEVPEEDIEIRFKLWDMIFGEK